MSSTWRCMEDLESKRLSVIGFVLDASTWAFFGCLCLGRWRLALDLFLLTIVLWLSLGVPLVDAISDDEQSYSPRVLCLDQLNPEAMHGEMEVMDVHDSGTGGQESSMSNDGIALGELHGRKNRWTGRSSKPMLEEELPGSSVLVFDEDNFFHFSDTVGNGGIVMGWSEELHDFDDKSEGDSFLDRDANSHEDFQCSYPHDSAFVEEHYECLGKLGGSKRSDGSFHPPQLETVSSDEKPVACQAHGDSTHHRPDQNLCCSSSFDGSDDETPTEMQRWADVFDSEADDFFPEKLDENAFFSDENAENKDNGALDLQSSKNKDVDFQFKPGIWEHKHVENLISAPWRRRNTNNSTNGAFDLTLFDSSDDSPTEPLAPPGVFDFTAKPGFGIRNIAFDGEADEHKDSKDATATPPVSKVAGSATLETPTKGRLDNEHEQSMLDGSQGGQELPHSHNRTGYIYMLADPDRELMVHCTDIDTVRQLANFALSLAYQAAVKNKMEHSSNLWKSRAHQERNAKIGLQRELDSSISIMTSNTYNALEEFHTILGLPFTSAILRQQDIQETFDFLFDDCEKELAKSDAWRTKNRELRASLADMNALQTTNEELKVTVDNLKTLNIRLMTDMRRIQKEATEDELEMCLDTDGDAELDEPAQTFEKELWEDNDCLASFMQAASVQKRMKLYCFRVQRGGHPQEVRVRKEIRQILREAIPEESVMQQAEARLWQMGTSISDYTSKALVLAAQYSSAAAETDDFDTYNLANESHESEVNQISKNSGNFRTSGTPRRARRGGKGKKDKKGKKSGESDRCTESPSSAHLRICEPTGPPHTNKTHETCEPHGPPQLTTDQLNRQQKETSGRCTESPSSAHLPSCEPIGPPHYENFETCEPIGPTQSPPDQLNPQQKGISNLLDTSNEISKQSTAQDK